MSERHRLIIGIGNEYRGDDAAGLIVARKLRPRLPEDVSIIEQSGEGTALMEIWQYAQQVILIDAIYSEAAPGTIFRFEAQQQALPTRFFNYSTHAFGIAEAVEMARTLKQLPQQLLVYGIAGENFALGLGLSPLVEQAISEVVARILVELHTTAT